jgi:O-antigen ligase
MTASRAGLLSLIVAVVVCLWEFAIKGRHRYLLVIVGIAGCLVSAYAADGVMHRWSKDESAAASTEQRKELFIRSLEVTLQHPLFGVGPGNFVILSGAWLASHNAYTQMSSEGGVPALILYMLILWRAFVNVKWIKGRASGRGNQMLASGLCASLCAFLVGSFFASVAYDFVPYFLVLYTTILYRISAHEPCTHGNSHVILALGDKASEVPLQTWQRGENLPVG